jgi:maleylacetoacetate isomerase/maleylpyruvate isomerase
MTMKLYGFWRSLATYRVRVALALKGLEAEQRYINLLQGAQHGDDYKTVNPQSVVPALVIDERPPLFQSLAIIEYLEETCPEPALLPKDPRGRARVRGLSLIVACDAHPLIVPRIRNYLEREMHQDEAARNRSKRIWRRSPRLAGSATAIPRPWPTSALRRRFSPPDISILRRPASRPSGEFSRSA